MRKIVSLLTASTIMLFLVACMVPGTFTTKYTLDKTGQYTMVYDGTLINLIPKLAELEATKKGRPAGPQAEKEAQALGAQVEKDTRTKSFKDMGNSTYKVVMEDGGNIKELGKVHFMSKDFRYWTLAYNEQDNTVSFIIEAGSQKNLDLLKELKVSPTGEVSFSTDLNLVSSSKKLSKSFFGNTYSIKVDDVILKEGLTAVWSLE